MLHIHDTDQDEYGHFKAGKAVSYQTTVLFLRYVLGPERVCTSEHKFAAVSDWLIPMTAKELNSFLVFANFYSYLMINFSLLAAPIHAMIHKNTNTQADSKHSINPQL